VIVEYLLLNRPTLIVFDGLDELLETHNRAAVVQRVESFANVYPAATVLVTSRRVGYAAAPLDEAVFARHELTDLTEEDVETYAAKWFGLDQSRSAGEVQNFVRGFMLESDGIPDLRRNPLILGLLCSLYRGQGFVPQNRPGVYEQCAALLFERWDKSRQIGHQLPAAAYLRPTFAHLGHALSVRLT
jgi:predicted NACHT family NTPase